MRLLHTRELRFQEFFDSSIPPYAILSHRWVDEVSYQEFVYLNRNQWAGGQVIVPFIVADDSRRDSSGFRKVMKLREIAAAEGHDWVWADTVCIDKTSSAELSEAINSMFRWYENSRICYAYLSDVVVTEAWGNEAGAFATSQWFKRGWTLQELIAPRIIQFRDGAWDILGDKYTLRQQLRLITRIPIAVLEEPARIFLVPVAYRMSLAIGRETSRIEDRAYSLLGLFQVNMPLLYGEAHKAFRRLQWNIIQQNKDLSIFAHTGYFLIAEDVDRFAPHQSQQRLEEAERLSRAVIFEGLALLRVRDSILTKLVAVTPFYYGATLRAAYLKTGKSSRYRLIILSNGYETDDSVLPFLLVEEEGIIDPKEWWKQCLLMDGSSFSAHRMPQMPLAFEQSIQHFYNALSQNLPMDMLGYGEMYIQ